MLSWDDNKEKELRTFAQGKKKFGLGYLLLLQDNEEEEKGLSLSSLESASSRPKRNRASLSLLAGVGSIDCAEKKKKRETRALGNRNDLGNEEGERGRPMLSFSLPYSVVFFHILLVT